MSAYIIRRVLYTIPILFGVSLIVFALFHLVGGDPVLQMLGKHATAEQVQELRRELGFDLPKVEQYFVYLKQIFTMDFGRSYATRQQIGEMIMDGIGPSFSLAATGFSVTLVLSLLVAMFSAYYRGQLIDKIVVLVCVAGMSISSLAYILFGQYFLAYKLNLFPVSGYESGFPYNMPYLMMPVLIWVTVSLGWDVRFFRTSILDETYKDYVRTARAKGLSEKVVFFKHILKNSMIPIITYIVIQIPFLILGSFLLESFFSIPGIGSITIEAITNSDFPVLKAMTTLISILMVIGNLVTDILYTVVDPRVRLR